MDSSLTPRLERQDQVKAWSYLQAISAHDRALRSLLVQHYGFEVCTEGDAFLVAFTNPEDACAWCIAVQQVSSCCSGVLSCRLKLHVHDFESLVWSEQAHKAC